MELIANIGLYVIGFLLWGLIVASIISVIIGIWKKSWKSFLFSGLTLFVPAIVLATQPGWLRLMVGIPILLVILAFFTKRKQQRIR
ncbi:hypothetical protein [Alkalihalobacterium elongatum]|uniref:hypothetical protein n=1 Tax=Alkalihalobacterium elongatum TaxID=2675466 RepID=UPI001C1FB976|nr:hypothetical protein [Alkalihalobacterium elongatum]